MIIFALTCNTTGRQPWLEANFTAWPAKLCVWRHQQYSVFLVYWYAHCTHHMSQRTTYAYKMATSLGVYSLHESVVNTDITYWRCSWWSHDNVIKWKHFPRYWLCVRGIHRLPVNSPHKGQWRGVWYFLWSPPEKKRLSKQSRRRWLETPWRSLWRHYNAMNEHVLGSLGHGGTFNNSQG